MKKNKNKIDINTSENKYKYTWSNLKTNPNLDIWTLDCLSLVFFLSKDAVIDNRSCRDPTMHCVLASSVTKKSRNPSQNKHFKIICTHTNSSKVKLNHGFPMLYFFKLTYCFDGINRLFPTTSFNHNYFRYFKIMQR